MRELSLRACTVTVALLAVAACYSGGEALDLDLAALERTEFQSIDARGNPGGRFVGWLARTPHELETGLAFVERDRLEPAEDGRIPAMVYVRAESDPLPSFKQRLVVTDILALSPDGTVRALGTMPQLPPFEPDTRVFIEALAGEFAKAGVGRGTRIQGLSELLRRER